MVGRRGVVGSKAGRRRRAVVSAAAYLHSLSDDPEARVERKTFLADLSQYYRRKWGVKLEPPRIGGATVDLFLLYSTVVKLGGWLKVTNSGRWWEVAEAVGLKDDICGADHALKLLYIRYLNRYERVRVFGDAGDEESEESSRSGRSRNMLLSTLATGDCPYNRPRAEVGELVRKSLGLPPVPSQPYSALVRSLESGLPNELSFALNILTLLSHPGPKLLRLADAPRILGLLLAHIGVFEDGEQSMRQLYFNGWRTETRLPFLEFWEAGAEDSETRDLAASFRAQPLTADDGLFTGRSPPWDPSQPLTHRVLHVVSILRNLSFEAPNRAPMAASLPLLKLITMSIYSKYAQLHSIAYDILSNIGPELSIGGPEGAERAGLVLRCLAKGLASDDKLALIRSLETLAGLCSREENEETLSDFLTAPLLRKILACVVVKDIMLAVYVLEALYQVTELGPRPSEKIAAEPHAIDVLVDMATVEAVSFGPSGLAGMKVVEYGVPSSAPSSQLAPGLASTSQTPQPTPARIQSRARLVSTSMPPPAVPAPGLRVSSSGVVSGVAGAPVRASAVVIRSAGPSPLVPASPASLGAPGPAPAPAAPTATSSVPRPIITPAGLPSLLAAVGDSKALDPAEQDQQAEDLVVTWLKTNLVLDPMGSVSRGELYAAYVSEMHKVYMSLCVSASTFGSLIKKNFPMLTIRRVEGGSRPNMMHLDGVRYVPKQIVFSSSNQPASLAKALPSLAQSHPLVNSMLSTPGTSASVPSATSTPVTASVTIAANSVTPKRQLTTVAGKSGPVRILVVRKPAAIAAASAVTVGPSSASAAVPAAAPSSVLSALPASSPAPLTAAGAGAEPATSASNNPAPSLNGDSVKVERLPPNCHLEVCEHAQEAKALLGSQVEDGEARIVRVENAVAAAGLPPTPPPVTGPPPPSSLPSLSTASPPVPAPQPVTTPPLPHTNGAKTPTPAPLNLPSHLNSTPTTPPKTTNVSNGVNGVKPHLINLLEKSGEPLKNHASARTPSPDSIKSNLINCQANIAELLKTEEKEGDNGTRAPTVNGAVGTPPTTPTRTTPVTPTTTPGKGRGRGRGSGRGRGAGTGTASPGALDSTPTDPDAPRIKKSHKKKKPHELIRNQKAAAALLAAQQKAAADAAVAAKRAAEGPPAEAPPEPKRPVVHTYQAPVLASVAPAAAAPVPGPAPPPAVVAVPAPGPAPTAPAFRTLTIPAPGNLKFMCEWGSCGRVFEKANQVYLHAARTHVTAETRACLWPHCDPNVPRHRWSLTTHLQDIHCSEGALRTASLRRYEMSVSSSGESSIPPPRTPPPHPGYSRTAAFDAVRRHALNYLPKELTEENEGPVTKSIRLTSCLILRNLARYSQEGRRKLRKHESSLCVMALSRLESSSSLAQLLHELSQPRLALPTPQ